MPVPVSIPPPNGTSSDHRQAFYPALLPQRTEETKVFSAIFSWRRQETRTERTFERSHQSHRRDEATQSTVRLPSHCPAGQSWLTMLGYTKDSLWSRNAGPLDLFRAESITLKTHWIMVVMDQYTRRIVGFGVHKGNVEGPALCRMFNDATSGQGWPERISSDNDPLFQYHRWKANLRILEIEAIKSLPYVPMSHPFVERLIGRVRRELLDQTFFWTATDLENKLQQYRGYYNEYRCHSSRDGATPQESESKNVVDLNSYRWRKLCRGLFQLPVVA